MFSCSVHCVEYEDIFYYHLVFITILDKFNSKLHLKVPIMAIVFLAIRHSHQLWLYAKTRGYLHQ